MKRNRLIFAGLTAAMLAGCSTSRVNTIVSDNRIDEIQVEKQMDLVGHYRESGSVSAETTVTVTVDGNIRTIKGDDFEFSIDKDGGKQYREELSKIYLGNRIALAVSTPTQSNNLFGNLFGSISAPKVGAKSDKDYAVDVVNYFLIKKAREAGADAFLDAPYYEWEIKEDSKYETWFWFLKFLRKYQVDYTVRATAKTAKLEYRSATTKVEEAAGQNGDAQSPVTVNVYNSKARTSAKPAAATEGSKGSSASDAVEAEPESNESEDASPKKQKKKKKKKASK